MGHRRGTWAAGLVPLRSDRTALDTFPRGFAPNPETPPAASPSAANRAEPVPLGTSPVFEGATQRGRVSWSAREVGRFGGAKP